VLLRQIEDATDLNNTRVDDGLVRSWIEPSEGVDKHRGYAFQWFLLAALCVVLAVGACVAGFKAGEGDPRRTNPLKNGRGPKTSIGPDRSDPGNFANSQGTVATGHVTNPIDPTERTLSAGSASCANSADHG
jgi:hypothetical protein